MPAFACASTDLVPWLFRLRSKPCRDSRITDRQLTPSSALGGYRDRYSHLTTPKQSDAGGFVAALCGSVPPAEHKRHQIHHMSLFVVVIISEAVQTYTRR